MGHGHEGEPTPRPWHVSEYGGTACAQNNGRGGPDAYAIAVVSDPDDPMHATPTGRANTEYIVKAVNNHAGLLEALKMAKVALNALLTHPGSHVAAQTAHAAYSKARAAIEAAEGGK